jgi:hypothetical protein
MRRAGVIFLFCLIVLGVFALFCYFFWHDLTEAQAIILTALVAALIALWGLFSQRAIARRQCTFEHIARGECDGDLLRARRAFRALARGEGGLAKWAAAEHEQSDEAQCIFTVINEFELVAIGIQRGIIDFELFARWFKTGTVNKWNEAAPFVTIMRQRRGQSLYYEFEQMVGWFNDNKMPRRVWWFGWIV